MFSVMLASVACSFVAQEADSHARVINDSIAAIHQVCDVLAMVKDKKTAEQHKAALKALADRLAELKKRAARLPALATEEQRKLAVQFLPEFEKLKPRMADVQKKLTTPAIKEVLGDLQLSPK